METRAYLYKWTHVPTNKWYIGSRARVGCHPNDGYICSSTAIKNDIISNRELWKREILAVGPALFIRQLEGSYLTALDAVNDPNSFNRHNNDGNFHRVEKAHSKFTKKLLAEKNIGKKHTDATRLKMPKSRQGRPGTPHTENTKKYLSDINIGKVIPIETRQKISATLTGQKRREDTKEKISNTVKNLQKIECEHCGNYFLPAHYGRFHGIRCKRNINE